MQMQFFGRFLLLLLGEQNFHSNRNIRVFYIKREHYFSLVFLFFEWVGLIKQLFNNFLFEKKLHSDLGAVWLVFFCLLKFPHRSYFFFDIFSLTSFILYAAFDVELLRLHLDNHNLGAFVKPILLHGICCTAIFYLIFKGSVVTSVVWDR